MKPFTSGMMYFKDFKLEFLLLLLLFHIYHHSFPWYCSELMFFDSGLCGFDSGNHAIDSGNHVIGSGFCIFGMDSVI